MGMRSQPGWGAEYQPDGAVRFRLWAPGQQHIALRIQGEDRAMNAEPEGWFSLQLQGIAHGAEYQYVLDDGTAIADPASRAQRDDVEGPSLVIDHRNWQWQDQQWQGRPWEETVTYELHVGTFTPAGTFAAASEKLPELAALGITVIELLPLSHFGGSRGWGYDGVLLYAPHAAYGSVEEVKAFVDAAHQLGLSVVLDIVLNHFGPQGNYLPLLAPDFFHVDRITPWGAGIAYEHAPVRDYMLHAPLYWLQEYHFDGLRFDAIDQIKDASSKHILVEIAERIRAAIPQRALHLTTEDNRNVIFLHPRAADGSFPLFNGEWNDDFHNAAHVLATGETHGYYQDFAEQPEKLLARTLAEGFAWQGEFSPHSGEPRGVKSSGQPPTTFVNFIQNHDQTGNRAHGERLLSLAGVERTQALLATLLLSPHIPLLFMGEEYGETRPFLFFTDFTGELAQAVREGRAREFAGHSGHEGEDVPDPNAVSTFTDSRLDWQRRASAEGTAWLAFTQQLLALRRQHIIPHLAGVRGNSGTILAAEDGFLAVSWQFAKGQLSLALNLGPHSQPIGEMRGDTLFALPAVTDTLAPNGVIVRFAPREVA
ncbi:malto-oligosyltrehalose trehalohydrolase [Candidatus Pantoea multigeneris]|uniref:Malto-oligosyltrehalose trehalohydrolase n=1 Tax=Candidatus Pantoea multigeneris TaxID=2608357 RepID=A0ABX0RFG1_9GAMM|nr:malto-oligosyltrehalose trehalohydrolase [Pantoea multigeneris]NIF21970.1 malto-oligosyltrehalose trehalohydrolase [Pantoea multigeneris]